MAKSEALAVDGRCSDANRLSNILEETGDDLGGRSSSSPPNGLNGPNGYCETETEDVNRLLTNFSCPESNKSSSQTSYRRSVPRSRRSHRRTISKSGECNVALLNVSDKRKRYMQDCFNTLIECRWRYTLLVFFLGHFVSWFLFALLWYLMAAAHGDLYDLDDRDGTLPCVMNMHDFLGCFMYSMESQTTIGYGTSYPSKECPEAVFLLCSQSVIGLIIQAFTVGIVFSKMTRPSMRAQTLLFSRRAVVALRDGYLTLQFRVADLRKANLVNAKLQAHLVRSRTTLEGEVVDMDRQKLPVCLDGVGNKLTLVWPATAIHRIDETSPLYNDSPNDLSRRGQFEIVVFLEGTIQATGQTTQARTSYVASEILWGHRLYPMVRYNKDMHRYEADFKRFDETLQVNTPLCSARDLDSYRNLVFGTPWTPDTSSCPSGPFSTQNPQYSALNSPTLSTVSEPPTLKRCS